ncbi:MAG: NAD(P)/FAD-dependent oxidoreductase [Alphaproteobacteria bacterium]|nr:NAD(P)/FAD-dependent oxidoreductase [Alphaproteobacteria bacterium]
MSGSDARADIAIVGAGPVGLFTVFEAGMLGMRCQVFDALDVVGGQCAALYPEKPIYDIPGYPVISAQDLIERLVQQAAPFAPLYRLGARVERLVRTTDGLWRLETADARVQATAVVISAGGGVFAANRPPLAGIEEFEGKSVFYLVRRRADFAGKRVVIAGGGDSAVDWAIALADVAASVAMVHRRAKFRAAPDSVARLHALAAAGKVELVVPYQIAGVHGSGGVLAAVEVALLTGERKLLPADALLAFFGLATSLGPIAEWGVRLERDRIAIDPATCESSLPGVYAIGDIASYPNKLKLILSGFAEAAMAAHAIYGRVFPGRALHFEYSTTKGLPVR